MHNALQGSPRRPHRGAVGDVGSLQRDELARAHRRLGHRASSTTRSRRRCTAGPREGARAGCGAATSTSRRPTRPRSSGCCRTSRRYPQSVFHVERLRAARGWRARSTSCRRRSTRSRRRTWRCRPRTPPTSASSSGSTSTGRCSCQVSRFDPWKDPLGVIDAYRIVKEAGARRVSSRSSARWRPTTPRAGTTSTRRSPTPTRDPDIHILNNFNNVGAIEVNAFQSHSDVLIQKSTREGFGLTVSEAIWKGRPFIGGDVGGIPLQVDNGVSGYLVDSVEQCAERMHRHPQGPGAGQGARAARQGARAQALPDAAATCATTCGSSPTLDGQGCLMDRRHRTARPRLEPRPGHLRTTGRSSAGRAAWSRR